MTKLISNYKYVLTGCLLVILNLHPFNVKGQRNGGVIQGRVWTADGAPAYVTVELKGLGRMTMTDANGNFRLLNLPALQDTLVFSSVHSERYSRAVILAKNAVADMGVVQLTFNIAQLADVEVKGRREHSYKSDYSFLGTKTQTPLLEIPQAISSITKEMIEDKMDFTLREIADEAAGVNNYSGYDDYSIRGFKAENARLINGLRGYNTTYTSAMLVNIERIEVVKGPAATLYGNCDPGGTINLVTKKPLSRQEGRLDLTAGAWNHFRLQGDVTGPLNKSRTLLYRLNVGYDNTNSFRDLFHAKSQQVAASFSYIPNDRIQLNLDFSWSHINTILDRGQPGFNNTSSLKSTPIRITASQPGDFLHESDLATSLLFAYRINKSISFNSGYLNYITQQNVAEHGIHDYITNDSVNLYYSCWNYHTITHTINNYFTFHFKTGVIQHQLLLGYDFVSSNLSLDQKYFERAPVFGAGSGVVGTFSLKNPIYEDREVDKYELSAYQSDASKVDASIYHTQGIYLQEQLNYKQWKLLIGLREEMYAAGDEDDTADRTRVNIFLPRLGLVYQLRPNISFYATYNNGFDPFEASTSTQVFNAPFKPVKSQLMEIGAKGSFFSNRLSASLALYQLSLQNVAVNANDIANPNLYIQEGEERSRGVEMEANGNILTNLSVSISFSHCVAKVIKSKIASQVGALVENAPENTSNSWIKYSFRKGSLKGLSLVAGHSQASSRTTLDPNLMLPGYLVLNGGARYAFSHFTLALNVNNITNRVYWMGAFNNAHKWPGSPRNLMASLAYQF